MLFVICKDLQPFFQPIMHHICGFLDDNFAEGTFSFTVKVIEKADGCFFEGTVVPSESTSLRSFPSFVEYPLFSCIFHAISVNSTF